VNGLVKFEGIRPFAHGLEAGDRSLSAMAVIYYKLSVLELGAEFSVGLYLLLKELINEKRSVENPIF